MILEVLVEKPSCRVEPSTEATMTWSRRAPKDPPFPKYRNPKGQCTIIVGSQYIFKGPQSIYYTVPWTLGYECQKVILRHPGENGFAICQGSLPIKSKLIVRLNREDVAVSGWRSHHFRQTAEQSNQSSEQTDALLPSQHVLSAWLCTRSPGVPGRSRRRTGASSISADCPEATRLSLGAP